MNESKAISNGFTNCITATSEPMRSNIENTLANACDCLESCHMTISQIERILMPVDGPDSCGAPIAPKIGIVERADRVSSHAMNLLSRLQDLRDRLGN